MSVGRKKRHHEIRGFRVCCCVFFCSPPFFRVWCCFDVWKKSSLTHTGSWGRVDGKKKRRRWILVGDTRRGRGAAARQSRKPPRTEKNAPGTRLFFLSRPLISLSISVRLPARRRCGVGGRASGTPGSFSGGKKGEGDEKKKSGTEPFFYKIISFGSTQRRLCFSRLHSTRLGGTEKPSLARKNKKKDEAKA